MPLELVHGLFITETEFRLTTHSFRLLLLYNWYHSTVQTFIIYTSTDYNIYGAFPLLIPLADSPCSPCPPCSLRSPCSLFRSPSIYLEPSLLWHEPSTSVSDCLWTELLISLLYSYTPQLQNPDPPGFLTSKYKLIRTVSRTWLTRSSTSTQ